MSKGKESTSAAEKATTGRVKGNSDPYDKRTIEIQPRYIRITAKDADQTTAK